METTLTSNKSLLAWLDEKVELTKPSKIVWIDGSKEQIDALKAEAVETGEMIKLNEELLPDCYLHRTAENDVARVEDRTLICSKKEEDAGPTNHWMEPSKAYKMLYDIAAGAYEGRTMYIIPYSMGPVGSPFSKVGIEITDSIYVVLNMNIMTRVGKAVLDVLGDSNDWVRGMHCKCNVDPEKRWICQFPEDNTIISVNSAYGGNVLLGKKCFALRIASYLGKNEMWQAEHMLILGLQKPSGEIKYLCAAFPSACGKTNLAMLIPPEGYQKKGYKIWTVGDDIAWIRVGEDGPTHHGVFDLSYLRQMPNMCVMAPKDEEELRHMLATAIAIEGPAAVRYPRGAGLGVPLTDSLETLPVGKAEVLQEEGNIAFLAVGTMVEKAKEAAAILKEEGIEAAVVNMRFIKPLDTELLGEMARTKRLLITAEENVLAGGFGSAVAEYLADHGIEVPLLRFGIPDRFIEQGTRRELLSLIGLQPDEMAERIRERLSQMDENA